MPVLGGRLERKVVMFSALMRWGHSNAGLCKPSLASMPGAVAIQTLGVAGVLIIAPTVTMLSPDT